MKRLGLLFIMMLLATATTAETPTPPPVTEVVQGQLAFLSNRDGDWEIYTMDADGSNAHRLTNNSGWDGSPAWSSDGQQLAFISERNGDENLYLMNADGENLRLLAQSDSPIYEFAWSPDGTKIAFALADPHQPETRVDIVMADVPNLRSRDSITTGGLSILPTWLPSGGGIAFVSVQDGGQHHIIEVLSPDGNHQINVADMQTNVIQTLAWSPDGSKLLFQADIGPPGRSGNPEIQLLDLANGKVVTDLTGSEASDFDPIWSLDGQHIIFVSYDDGNPDVYQMDTDGSHRRNLTGDIGYGEGPLDVAFSPDGKHITFTGNPNGPYVIYMMDADGGHVHALTDDNAMFDNRGAVWRPIPKESK